jgi:hypothetical protein
VAKPTNDAAIGFKESSEATTAKLSVEYVLFNIKSTKLALSLALGGAPVN